ncbi:MAG: type II secretion system protein GspM [Pseudomonas sp.]|uniref:type II secretion system protein GspM n=1 Tax=Pseudomonas sp. TaxID=306 RepID=UPI003393342B
MSAAFNKHQGPISLALLAILILLAGMLVWVPVQAQFARYDEELFRDGRQLQRLQSIDAARMELEILDRQFRERGLQDWVYNSDTEQVAIGLDIQRRVTSTLGKSTAQLRSITPLPAQRRGESTMVGVRVNFSASMPALMESLQALEQGKPLLLVEDFRINPSAARARQPGGGVSEQVVEVQMSVVTFLPVMTGAAGAGQ